MTVSARPLTLLDGLRDSFDVSLRTPDGHARLAALLWTDSEAEWLPILPALKSALPQLYSLGDYKPAEHQGPVIWLKCVVDRALPDVSPPPGMVPIVYLPKVGRQDLRAGSDCPQSLQPLVELLYRGATWNQRNGRDWTVEAFLTSENGLGLNLAQDTSTRAALHRALPLLVTEPLTGLLEKRLEAEDFDRLSIGDPVRDMLNWMCGPDAFKKRGDAARWEAFVSTCRREFHFDPDLQSAVEAAELILAGDTEWEQVWSRYCDAPTAYSAFEPLLRQAKAPKLIALHEDREPLYNENQEQTLRSALESISSLPHREACERVVKLEDQHGVRRKWVWAALEHSALAAALEPLATLARSALQPVGGQSLKAIIDEYVARGWRCDSAVIRALALEGNEPVVGAAVRALYEPWLDRSTRNFQERVLADSHAYAQLATGVAAERDTCVLFIDGLRYDLGVLLLERLEATGRTVRLGWRIAPIPTVTNTGKPLASPAHPAFRGKPGIEDFAPVFAQGGQRFDAGRLREELSRRGVQVLQDGEPTMPLAGEQGGWAEFKDIDELGHNVDAFLFAEQVERQVDEIAERIEALLTSGWNRVRIVTDHGWLLLPGGLKKVDLPAHLVESKWSRCATVQGASNPAVPTYPWHWDAAVQVASPPGACSFRAGRHYAHGGVSLQECVTPDLMVERGAEPVSAAIKSVSWRGMRCRVAVESKSAGLRVDLRLNRNQPASSIVAAPKPVEAGGESSLAVPDDKHEGNAAVVVVIDPSGRVLDSQATTVGGA